jgi:hypothetical protein
MNDLDPDRLAVLELDPATAERIRRRGRRVLDAPAAGPWVRAEAGLVLLFSVATLLWAVSAVVQVG